MSHPAPDVLDPGDPSPRLRAQVLGWLQVQHELALRPAEAASRLREDPDPRGLLEAAGAARAAARTAGGRPSTPEDLERARRALVACGARLVPLPSPAYPASLARLPDAAPVLSVRGVPEVLHGACVAIVGARAATAYGIEVARRLADGLARAGIVVVSGLARGVDGAAHAAALAAGGLTVAIQACGPDLVYPAAHRALAARIAGHGAVVSELAPGSPPRKAHFPLRNRLISGLSRAVVVVEARLRSGSLVTARHALDQGIEVLAVPGPVTAPTSEGTNRLLRDGAAPALEVADVLRAAGLEPAPRAAPAREPAAPEPSSEAGRVLAALGHRPATRDELGRLLALAPGRLAATLLALELEGRVVEDRDGRLRPARARLGKG